MTEKDTGGTVFNETPLNTQQENRMSVPKRRTSVFAILSLFFGCTSILTFSILFFCQGYISRNIGIFAIVLSLIMIVSFILAIGLGIAGMKQTGKNSNMSGHNLAITGLVMCSLIILYIICALILSHVF
jgi:H+/Cl- antiporter ClcA